VSLHITLSTTSPAAANLRGWQRAGMPVEFLYEGSCVSIELGTSEIKNHFNKDSENLTAIDHNAGRDHVLQPNKCSGRYRRNNALPI
jgi:hypothetical protein